MASLPEVHIYSDGSCEGNPGPGGWAALIRENGREHVLTGTEKETTNNRMELTAALKAIQSLTRTSTVHMHTDSQYLRRGVTEWLPGWRARGWRRKGGVLANVDLWQDLERAIQKHQISWHWIKGHSGHTENERVDKLARQAAQK